jgi:hypothetical protein
LLLALATAPPALAADALEDYKLAVGTPGHALNIMLPGSLVGLIVGYAAQQRVAPAGRATR